MCECGCKRTHAMLQHGDATNPRTLAYQRHHPCNARLALDAPCADNTEQALRMRMYVSRR